MSDSCVDNILKKYLFGDENGEHVEITISQNPTSCYGSFLWPSAFLMAEYMWFLSEELNKKFLLELGSGIGLPGLVAASRNARVVFTDHEDLNEILENIRILCKANNPIKFYKDKETFYPLFLDVNVKPLTWGRFSASTILQITENYTKFPDYIITSDCFYDNSENFDNLLATATYFLERNSNATFLMTYQLRRNQNSLNYLFNKWNLSCKVIPLEHSDDSTFEFPSFKYVFSSQIQLLEIKIKH